MFVTVKFKQRYQVGEVRGLNFGPFLTKQNRSLKNSRSGICNKRISYVCLLSLRIGSVTGYALSYMTNDGASTFKQTFKSSSGGEKSEP